MKVQPFKRQGYYTVFDNDLLDHVMPTIKPSSWAVLCVLIRRTIGWQKDSEIVAHSEMMTKTGIKSDKTVRNSIKELADLDLIFVQSGKGAGSPNFYTLNRECTIDVPDECSGGSVKITDPNTVKITDPPYQNLPTLPPVLNKGNKYIIGDDAEQGFEDIRSEPDYRDLQNEIVAVCKKLNILSLKEDDVRNIDILYAAEVKPAEVREFFSRNGQSSWWCTQHWKGKKGQFASTQDIIDTIEQARAYSDDGHNNADVALQEVQEWIRGERKFPDFSSPVTVEVIRDMGEYELKNKNPQFWAIRFKETFATFNPDS